MKENIKNHFVVKLKYFKFAKVNNTKNTTMNKKILYHGCIS
ncbi:hypothetical protein SAMN05421841_2674 [Chryseobacterium wanjuense]|uniref:Uncharacterized protein n=1 Tax=Chryseobacterium wanjuense TaxID=356305 RepID=A0A1I0RH28_9FLAO|nr:hypothetical protein SAMN05421841_2674 [Chryseobacterium wanjuense]